MYSIEELESPLDVKIIRKHDLKDSHKEGSHLFADFRQIVCPKSFGQVILLRHLTLGHVYKN